MYLLRKEKRIEWIGVGREINTKSFLVLKWRNEHGYTNQKRKPHRAHLQGFIKLPEVNIQAFNNRNHKSAE